MPNASSHTPRDAISALTREVRNGGYQVEVVCPHDDCDTDLLLVNVSRAYDQPPEEDEDGEYEPLEIWEPDAITGVGLSVCPGCAGELSPDTVVLRDRKRRCAQAIADEVADDRSGRLLDLNAALRRGDIVTASRLLDATGGEGAADAC